MQRKAGIIFLIAALLNFTIGCVSDEVVTVTKKEVDSRTEKIVSLVKVDGTLVQYDSSGAYLVSKFQDRANVVVGMTIDSVVAVTSVDSILEIRIERTESNAGKALLVGLGVVALVIIAAGAFIVATSCPYIYTYDGAQYRFAAEPLGGSTTGGLRRTDHSRLSHLVPAEGEYRLLVRNENEETQFIDQMSLLVIDHEPGTAVAPDYGGTFHTFRRSIPPSSVVDEEGRDVRAFFASRDDVRWQTAMPTDTSFRGQDVRHHLTFAFPKPENASTLSLMVNGGTAMWGSAMVREMLMMRGERLDDWYRDIDAHGAEMDRLAWFMDREELFTLKVNVLEGDAWVPAGLIHGGGPLADDDRIVTLDVSRVEGDTVRFRLDPPRGYWKIDCINAVEGIDTVRNATGLPASFGKDRSGRDVTALLRSNDSSYYVMPEVGDQCDLRFRVPDQAAGTSRAVYLKTAGYYRLHLPQDAPERTAFIREMGMNPGMIVRHSLERYYEYRQQALQTAHGGR